LLKHIDDRMEALVE